MLSKSESVFNKLLTSATRSFEKPYNRSKNTRCERLLAMSKTSSLVSGSTASQFLKDNRGMMNHLKNLIDQKKRMRKI